MNVISQAEAEQMDPGTGIRHEIRAWQQEANEEPLLVIEHGPDYPCPQCGWVLVAPDGRFL